MVCPGQRDVDARGDFEIAEAKKLVEKWFGSFPKSTKPVAKPPKTPVIAKPMRLELEDELVKLRRIDYIWHTPALFADGDAELDILSDALTRTGTGRLYKILVHEKQLAQSARTYQYSRGYSSSFHVEVSLKPDADLAEVEKIVTDEIERLRRETITKTEFDRAVTNVESGRVWGLESVNNRANTLQSYNHYWGNPDGISKDLDRYRKTDPEKVRATAARYLGKQNRAEILTKPKAKDAVKAAVK